MISWAVGTGARDSFKGDRLHTADAALSDIPEGVELTLDLSSWTGNWSAADSGNGARDLRGSNAGEVVRVDSAYSDRAVAASWMRPFE